MDMMQILQMLSACGNPKQYASQQLSQMARNNPVLASALNNPNNLEGFVRNLYKEQGINIDNVMSMVRNIR